MGKSSYTVEYKTLVSLQKKADKIQKMYKKIEQLEHEITNIQEACAWVKYLGENACITLSENQRSELSEAIFNIHFKDNTY